MHRVESENILAALQNPLCTKGPLVPTQYLIVFPWANGLASLSIILLACRM